MTLADTEIMDLFRRSGALQEGHFLLSSGLHSPAYWQCALALQHPDTAAALCRALAEPWRDKQIAAVIGPALGGVVLAYELARQLGARGLFMERADGRMTLRRSFDVARAERVLLAEDVMTTGGSVAEMIQGLAPTAAAIVGIASLVDRGGSARFPDHDVRSLLQVEIETYAPETCPLCRKGLALVKPGSRKKP